MPEVIDSQVMLEAMQAEIVAQHQVINFLIGYIQGMDGIPFSTLAQGLKDAADKLPPRFAPARDRMHAWGDEIVNGTLPPTPFAVIQGGKGDDCD